MTTFEFFKDQLDKAVAQGCGTTKVCTINLKYMSYGWVKAAADWFFGGAWDYQMKEVTDIAEMREKKLLKVMEYSNWRARQLGQTRKYALTNKGIKEFYKTMVKPELAK